MFDVVYVHEEKDFVSAVVARMDVKPLVDNFPKKLMGEYKKFMDNTTMGNFHNNQMYTNHMKARFLDFLKEGKLSLEPLATHDEMWMSYVFMSHKGLPCVT